MTSTRILLLALALAPFSLVACSEPGGGGDDIDCDAEPVPKFAEVTAFAKCTSCHSSTLSGTARQAAPEGVDFDTAEAAAAHAESAKARVEDGTMPPAGLPQLTDEEEQQIIRWASCGSPK